MAGGDAVPTQDKDCNRSVNQTEDFELYSPSRFGNLNRPMTCVPAADGNQRPAPSLQTVKVVVGDQGFEPERVTLRAGIPVRLTFLRTSDKTCGTEVTFPTLNVTRTLPLNQAVDIEFTPAQPGDIGFACGMNMLHGTVIVQ